MKKLVISLLLVFLFSINYAQTTEQEAVRELIQSAYVDGIHNKAGIDKIKQGFHPGFEMLGKHNELLSKFPIYSWIQNVKTAMENTQKQSENEKITAEFPIIDITGDAAFAKVELYLNEKHLFTDYLLLYKFDNEWKIVSKTYYRISEQHSL
ncbi:MAG: nuclear transport factor 2 family protein [Bacteroidales bacterium]|jgi:hypothetical protein|nr:nuclear transport factor 2 family protein [Bacteroidales bacterium]HOI31814.1 nuclear transport factor 2 family protein [Bacteroidales bacterium]